MVANNNDNTLVSSVIILHFSKCVCVCVCVCSSGPWQRSLLCGGFKDGSHQTGVAPALEEHHLPQEKQGEHFIFTQTHTPLSRCGGVTGGLAQGHLVIPSLLVRRCRGSNRQFLTHGNGNNS